MNAKEAIRWWWVRHAPVIDQKGVIHGNLDVACDLSAAKSFKALASILPPKALWLTSHLARAKETAAAIARHGPGLGQDIPRPIIEKNLAEQNFGDWQGKTWDDFDAAADEDYLAFWQNPAKNAPPRGESFGDVVKRVSRLINRHNAKRLNGNARFSGDDIVVIAHAGPIRAAIALALDLDLKKALAIKIDSLALTRLDFFADGIDHGSAGVPSRGLGFGWRVNGINLPPLML